MASPPTQDQEEPSSQMVPPLFLGQDCFTTLAVPVLNKVFYTWFAMKKWFVVTILH
jgi:hypothetical protein